MDCRNFTFGVFIVPVILMDFFTSLQLQNDDSTKRFVRSECIYIYLFIVYSFIV